MSSHERIKISVELATGVVGTWNGTYHWIPVFGAIAAFAMAFSAGANNLPASFSTPIGSGALTFLKASMVACVIYVPGAAFASNSSVNALFSDFIKENQPNEGFLMWSLVVVLITTTLWLALATYFELPVSSQQSTQGALLGTMLVTEGFKFIPLWNKNENHNFTGGGIVWIFLEWTIAPVIACICAFCFFTILRTSLLRHENAEKRILIFLPVYYGLAAGLLCLFLMHQVIPRLVTVYTWITIVAVAVSTLIGALLSLVSSYTPSDFGTSLKRANFQEDERLQVVVVPLARQRFDTVFNTKKQKNSVKQKCPEGQNDTSDAKVDDDNEEFEEALTEFMQMRVLDTVYEVDERSWGSPDPVGETELVKSASQSTNGQATPFRQLLESTPNRLVQTRNFQKIEKTTIRENMLKFIRSSALSTLFPVKFFLYPLPPQIVMKYDRHTLIRHALAEKFDEMEDYFGFPLLLASSIFALIQSASEVADLVSPYQAIFDVFSHRAKFSGNGANLGSLHVNWWFRALGGLSVSMGFFLFGWRLTRCLGSKLTYISNSRGMASQVSAVATIIVVTRMKLPVSSVHTFIGSLVGVGIADEPRNVNWKLLLKFLCGWLITILFCCSVAYGIYSISIHSPAYVVP
ncbi:hypothetical protein RJ640_017385 [Escallonia rubra]|uniref:Phosphate transporter n=1 Tax=Escallonia rubra TaxID=112253 RepID=A0AA88QSE6_9ASTE|nr:hypothetical protein RJ640_017385 [Escallonia rubra]